MTKNNYEVLRAYLEEHWKECGIIMFNCFYNRKKKQIQHWQDEGEGGLILQNDIDSFTKNIK